MSPSQDDLSDDQHILCEAIELQDLARLTALLRSGTSLDFLLDGLSPLHLALDVEADSAGQQGGPAHVDVTALLLCHGADPDDTHNGRVHVTARHFAFGRHDLATKLFELVEPEPR